MKTLSSAAYARAREFLRTRARAIDFRRFEFRFEGGSADDVLEALCAFRNDDGGFGRAFEPDCRYMGSWPVATAAALAILHELGVEAGCGHVRGPLIYLRETYNAEHALWPFTLPGMNRVPHAPWWQNNGDPDLHDGFALVNPLFAVVGCLHAYRDSVPADFLAEVTAVAMARIAEQPVAMEKHIVRDALFMQRYLPEPEREAVIGKLRAAAAATVERDPAQWTSYGAAPLWFAPTPDSPLAEVMGEDLDAHLDYEIDRQDTDGSWKPLWNWGEQYPNDWELAKGEWAGVLTLEMLTCLRAYGRIEGMFTEGAP